MAAIEDWVIPAIVTVVVAFLGYLMTYLNNLRLAQRKERLTRINKQLGEFYGPLFALTNATKVTWEAFRSKYAGEDEKRTKGIGYFFGKDVMITPEAQEWQLWIQTVFMPLNLRMFELILTKSDLLIDADMPASLLQLCAHVAAYQAVIKKWENKDFSEYTSLLIFPSEITEYARHSFQELKAEQAKLMGSKHSI
jgi:hypothetical protein